MSNYVVIGEAFGHVLNHVPFGSMFDHVPLGYVLELVPFGYFLNHVFSHVPLSDVQTRACQSLRVLAYAASPWSSIRRQVFQGRHLHRWSCPRR